MNLKFIHSVAKISEVTSKLYFICFYLGFCREKIKHSIWYEKKSNQFPMRLTKTQYLSASLAIETMKILGATSYQQNSTADFANLAQF